MRSPRSLCRKERKYCRGPCAGDQHFVADLHIAPAYAVKRQRTGFYACALFKCYVVRELSQIIFFYVYILSKAAIRPLQANASEIFTQMLKAHPAILAFTAVKQIHYAYSVADMPAVMIDLAAELFYNACHFVTENERAHMSR